MPAPRRISETQMEELVAWMERHPLQARAAQIGSAQAKRTFNVLWQELTSRLNAVSDGVSKTSKEWRQYWSDQKCKIRKKGSQQHGRGIGSELAALGIWSPIEERIANLIGVQNIIGNANIPIETDMGLDSPPAAPSPAPSSSSDNAPGTPPARPPPSRPQSPPRWALELEDRQVAVEELRLEEERAFRKSMLALEKQKSEEQRTFHRQILSLFQRLVEALEHD